MTPQRYRYTFDPQVPDSEVEGTLTLAVVAAEGLHGEARLRLEAGHALAADRTSCVIEVHGPAGRDLNQLFVTFLTREFGPDAFRVRRLATRRGRPAAA